MCIKSHLQLAVLQHDLFTLSCICGMKQQGCVISRNRIHLCLCLCLDCLVLFCLFLRELCYRILLFLNGYFFIRRFVHITEANQHSSDKTKAKYTIFVHNYFLLFLFSIDVLTKSRNKG